MQAEEHFFNGLVFIKQVGHKENICHILQNLGALNERRGNYAQAEGYYQDALVDARKIQYPERIVFLLNNLGVLVFNLGDYEQAEIIG